MILKCDVGIIGAMDAEVEGLISKIESCKSAEISGVNFRYGEICGKNVVVARCGVGKVFAALCAEAMILNFAPSIIVNSGVGGALDSTLRPLDIVFADRLVQHDMDTSPLGDPKGLISGINKIYFETDKKAVAILRGCAESMNINYTVGTVATGDRFICSMTDKERIIGEFGAAACEMEGGAIAQVAFVNDTPFAVIRAISDSANGEANMDYMEFLPAAAKVSFALTLNLIKNYR